MKSGQVIITLEEWRPMVFVDGLNMPTEVTKALVGRGIDLDLLPYNIV